MSTAAQALISALETKALAHGGPNSPDAVAGNEGGNPTADGLKLLRAFMNIRDATLRRSVIQLVELLAGPGAKA